MAIAVYALLIFLSVVAAPQAEAECAWVLWNDVTLIPFPAAELKSSFFLLGASPTFQHCEQSRIAKAKDLLRVTDSDKSLPNVDHVLTQENGNTITRTIRLKGGGEMLEVYKLVCLPDTVDPRGKGATR